MVKMNDVKKDKAQVPAEAIQQKRSKDIAALVISIVFVASVGILGYRYFNTSNRFSTPEGQVSSSNTQRPQTVTDEGNTNSTEEKTPTQITGNTQITNSTTNSGAVGDNTWEATDYVGGEIKAGNYQVQKGDTLWEIAEAVYGDGTQWVRILDANSGNIGFLPSGQQALIMSGQTLVIPN